MTPDNKTSILSFDPAQYPFHEVVAELVRTDKLVELRSDLAPEGTGEGASLYRNMEASPHFRALYDGLQEERGEAFYDLYRRFLREVIRPQFGGDDIYYQARPSHRILFADTPGASRFHRDRDYGHQGYEVNYLVVQTPAYGTNTMWLETAEGAEDYAPAELKLGEYIRFDGANLHHGAKQNETGATRVSFDFRVIPARLAPPEIQRGAEELLRSGNPVMDNARQFILLPS